MICPKCGYQRDALETTCPRCAKNHTPTGTKRLRELKTQHLVRIDKCTRCNWFLFPGDAFCTSCGAKVERSEKRAAASAQPTNGSPKNRERLLWGVTIGAAGIGVIALIFRLFGS